ncbi:uncharacterized protein BJ171DRAFT_138597 [Polychytrium aggregatum]|uniref:uncharacterized protein n=1 Tax=Polychytrium aggregatum TaxID=110093 RepID=UPI0022FEF39A|nr:uncharacterized protein BJ171DRAFT_138597 [Polychytrium aggregatum]KAI9203671.1 hypothetical protein BJ171DRAFT_138597 [Polychytrium aggregatum]
MPNSYPMDAPAPHQELSESEQDEALMMLLQSLFKVAAQGSVGRIPFARALLAKIKDERTRPIEEPCMLVDEVEVVAALKSEDAFDSNTPQRLSSASAEGFKSAILSKGRSFSSGTGTRPGAESDELFIDIPTTPLKAKQSAALPEVLSMDVPVDYSDTIRSPIRHKPKSDKPTSKTLLERISQSKPIDVDAIGRRDKLTGPAEQDHSQPFAGGSSSSRIVHIQDAIAQSSERLVSGVREAAERHRNGLPAQNSTTGEPASAAGDPSGHLRQLQTSSARDTTPPRKRKLSNSAEAQHRSKRPSPMDPPHRPTSSRDAEIGSMMGSKQSAGPASGPPSLAAKPLTEPMGTKTYTLEEIQTEAEQIQKLREKVISESNQRLRGTLESLKWMNPMTKADAMASLTGKSRELASQPSSLESCSIQEASRASAKESMASVAQAASLARMSSELSVTSTEDSFITASVIPSQDTQSAHPTERYVPAPNVVVLDVPEPDLDGLAADPEDPEDPEDQKDHNEHDEHEHDEHDEHAEAAAQHSDERSSSPEILINSGPIESTYSLFKSVVSGGIISNLSTGSSFLNNIMGKGQAKDRGKPVIPALEAGKNRAIKAQQLEEQRKLKKVQSDERRAQREEERKKLEAVKKRQELLQKQEAERKTRPLKAIENSKAVLEVQEAAMAGGLPSKPDKPKKSQLMPKPMPIPTYDLDPHDGSDDDHAHGQDHGRRPPPPATLELQPHQPHASTSAPIHTSSVSSKPAPVLPDKPSHIKRLEELKGGDSWKHPETPHSPYKPLFVGGSTKVTANTLLPLPKQPKSFFSPAPPPLQAYGSHPAPIKNPLLDELFASSSSGPSSSGMHRIMATTTTGSTKLSHLDAKLTGELNSTLAMAAKMIGSDGATKPSKGGKEVTTIIDSNGDLPEPDSDNDPTTPQKKKLNIPAWAETPELKRALHSQQRRDPESIFGMVNPDGLKDMFNSLGIPSKAYRARANSAWRGDDVLTTEENERYKQSRGYE